MQMHLYEPFKKDVLCGDFNFDANIYCALMDKDYSLGGGKEWWEDVWCDEVFGAGYHKGGQVLQNTSLARKDSRIVFDADDVIWNDVQVRVSGIVLYGGGINQLIAGFTTGGIWMCDRQFTIEWHKLGIISESNPDIPPHFFLQYLKEGDRDGGQ